MKRQMNRLILGTLVVIGSTISVNAYSEDLATINGKGYTDKEFKEAVKGLGPRGAMLSSNPRMRKQFLDHLIDSRLLAAKARAKGIDKSEDFKRRVADAQAQILANMYTDSYIADQTTDKKLEAHFKKNPKDFSKEEVKAAHILIKAEKGKDGDKNAKTKAEKLLKEAQKKGADFAAMAKKHSQGPSGPKGGDLGFFGRGRMVPEFEKAAFATKKGNVHNKIVKTQFGYHVIKVVDRKGGDKVKFADVKDDVKRRLERDLRKNVIEDLRKEAKVKVYEDRLEKLKL